LGCRKGGTSDWQSERDVGLEGDTERGKGTHKAQINANHTNGDTTRERSINVSSGMPCDLRDDRSDTGHNLREHKGKIKTDQVQSQKKG